MLTIYNALEAPSQYSISSFQTRRDIFLPIDADSIDYISHPAKAMTQDHIRMGTESLSLEDAHWMMEQLGYLCMRSDLPPEKSIRQVEAAFNQNTLKYSTPSFRYCKGGAECKSFIQDNHVCFPPNISCSKLILNKQLKRLIETTLGMAFDDTK